MLTRTQVQFYLKILIAVVVITLAMQSATIVIIIIQNLYGFYNVSLSYACPSSQYYLNKYSNDYYFLKIPFIFSLLAVLVILAALINLIIVSTRVWQKPEQQKQASKMAIIDHKNIIILFILLSVCSFFSVVPVGYYSTFLIEFMYTCSLQYTTNLYIIIIIGLHAFSLALLLICLYNVWKLIEWDDTTTEANSREIQQSLLRYMTQNNPNEYNQNIIQNIFTKVQKQSNELKEPLLDKNSVKQVMKQSQVKQVIVQQPKVSQKKQQKVQSKVVGDQKPSIIEINHIIVDQQKPPIRIIQQSLNKMKITQENQRKDKNDKKIKEERKDKKEPQIVIKENKIVPKQQETQSKKEAQTQGKGVKNIININVNPFAAQNPIQKIDESNEEMLSSDSDDVYYKRSRRGKKRQFQKRGKYQYEDVRRQGRKESRFQGDEQHKYIYFSPNSIRDLKNFFIEEEIQKEHSNRRNNSQRQFRNQYREDKQRNIVQNNHKQRQSKQSDAKSPVKKKLNLSSQVNQVSIHSPIIHLPSQEPTQTKPSQPQKMQANIQSNKHQILRPQTSFISDVINVLKTPQNNVQVSRIRESSASFYKQLHLYDSNNQIGKYKPFFEPKASLKQQTSLKQQKPRTKPKLQEYLEILNYIPRHGGQRSHQLDYLSQKNYSSILSEANEGKAPEQNEQRNRLKNLDLNDKKIKVNNIQRQQPKNQIMESIRNKYIH